VGSTPAKVISKLLLKAKSSQQKLKKVWTKVPPRLQPLPRGPAWPAWLLPGAKYGLGWALPVPFFLRVLFWRPESRHSGASCLALPCTPHASSFASPPHKRQAPLAGEAARVPHTSPATEPRVPVTKLDPLDRLQPIPAAHWTHGGLGGVEARPCSSSDRAAGHLFAHKAKERPRPAHIAHRK
jgi:hypothetical protein